MLNKQSESDETEIYEELLGSLIIMVYGVNTLPAELVKEKKWSNEN